MKTSCATHYFEKKFSTYLDWVFSWFLNLESWILIVIVLDSWKLETWNLSWIFLLILELFLTQSWNHSHGLFVIIIIIIKTPWINLDSSSWSNEACFYRKYNWSLGFNNQTFSPLLLLCRVTCPCASSIFMPQVSCVIVGD